MRKTSALLVRSACWEESLRGVTRLLQRKERFGISDWWKPGGVELEEGSGSVLEKWESTNNFSIINMERMDGFFREKYKGKEWRWINVKGFTMKKSISSSTGQMILD